MKVTISVECSTEDEALEVVQRLNGVTTGSAEEAEPAPAPKKAAKKATTKQKSAEKTKAAFDEDETEAEETPAKKKGRSKKAPTVEQLKAHLAECAGDVTDPDVASSLKSYVNSFGVPNVSAMSDEQRIEAYQGAEEYFSGGSEEEGEEEGEDW